MILRPCRGRRAWAGAVLAVATGLAGLPAASAGEPSEEYRAGLRRTLELRKQRRRSPGQAVGQIVPYPMPPALIIRHTRETHDEVQGLLDLLRYGGR